MLAIILLMFCLLVAAVLWDMRPRTLVEVLLACSVLMLFVGCSAVDPMYAPAKRAEKKDTVQVCDVFAGRKDCVAVDRAELRKIMDQVGGQ